MYYYVFMGYLFGSLMFEYKELKRQQDEYIVFLDKSLADIERKQKRLDLLKEIEEAETKNYLKK